MLILCHENSFFIVSRLSQIALSLATELMKVDHSGRS